jgi:senataxin
MRKIELNELRSRFKEAGIEGLDMSTVDGFQGREKDIIIFSCVRAHTGA